MIQALSIIALLIAIALPVIDYFVFRPRRAGMSTALPIRGIEWLIYIVFLISLALMTLSGVVTLAFGQRMHHWMLILHVTLAPLFAVCITALAVLWSAQLQVHALEGEHRFTAVERFAFWLVVACSFVTILSAMFGMMEWFGSEWQVNLLNIHRIAALILLVTATFQATRLLTHPRHSKPAQAAA